MPMKKTNVTPSEIPKHTHGNVAHSIERFGFETYVLPLQIAYDADDTHVFVDCNGTVFLQVVQDFVEVLGIVDRYGNSYLRRTDHIDGSLVALEDLEHLAEETVSKQHTARLDLDSSNIVLGSYCFDLTFFRIVGDQCARRKRVHGVQQADRNVGIFGRLNTGGVQNLGTEVGQLGSFFKMQLAHRRRFVDNARVVVVHTVDIGPDLDFGSMDSGTDQ